MNIILATLPSLPPCALRVAGGLRAAWPVRPKQARLCQGSGSLLKATLDPCELWWLLCFGERNYVLLGQPSAARNSHGSCELPFNMKDSRAILRMNMGLHSRILPFEALIQQPSLSGLPAT